VPEWKEEKFKDCEATDLRSVLYLGAKYKGKRMPVFAWVGIPPGTPPKNGFPGVVLAHGGGGTAFANYSMAWIKRGYAVIAMDLYNRRPLDTEGRKCVSLEGGWLGWEIYDSELMARATANIVIAHSLLRSLPKVDPERTALVGVSWGGFFSSLVAGIDGRFKIILPVYCHYPNYLTCAKSPIHFFTGTCDMNFQDEGLFKEWDLAGTMEANRSIVINLPHSHAAFCFPGVFRIIDAAVGCGPSLPRLTGFTVDQATRRVSATLASAGAGVRRTMLVYTSDSNPVWQEKIWKEKEVMFDGMTIEASLPDKCCLAYLAAYDGSDLTCCGTTGIIDVVSKFATK